MQAIEKMTPGAGAMVKHGFGDTTMAVSAQLASEATIAQVQAQVQARCVMAMRNPRDWDVVRQQLLAECARPGFAEAAVYTLSWAKNSDGEPVTGLSIRFAEAAMRALGNIYPETRVVYDDGTKRIVAVTVTELERNVTLQKEVVIEKTVERRHLRQGQVALSQRVNSTGETTYTVLADEGSLAAKQASAESKALRTLLLRILPGDLADEARAKIDDVMRTRAAKDPSATRKALIDSFFALGVSADEVKRYVGHPLEQLTPAELVELRQVHAALRDGEAKWSELLEGKLETRPKDKPTEQTPAPATASVSPAAPVAPLPPPSPPQKGPSSTPPPAPTNGLDIETSRQLATAASKSPGLLVVAVKQAIAKHPDLKAAIEAEALRLSTALGGAK